MDLPKPLTDQIAEGNVTLMLGSGASFESRNKAGKKAPSSPQLAELIARKFLSEDYATSPLNIVSAFAISEVGLFVVQDFIREIFQTLEPTKTHLLLPAFRWHALVTTNYDELIEAAYHAAPKKCQKLLPIRRNTDRYDLRDPDFVPLLKLHGCISATHEERCPMILTTDQYNDFMTNRDQLFRLLMTFASQHPVLMIGFSNQDADIRAIFETLTREQPSRPHYYLISPGVDDFHRRFWEKRQVTAIQGTFDQAMEVIDRITASPFRGLRKSTSAGPLAIAERFVVPNAVLSEGALKALQLDLDYVKEVPSDAADAQKFYSGVSHSWGAISEGFDVRRQRLEDSLLLNFFLSESKEFEFVLVKGYAGSGKSVFLRRLAWEAARTHNRLCLFTKVDGNLSSAVISEVIALSKERVFLFVDDVLVQRQELENLIRNLGTDASLLTIIGGARTNEWNSAPAFLQSSVSEAIGLPYLSPKELDGLIDLLEKHKANIKMKAMSDEQRREALREHAGQVLLVALHEATSGKRFEDILHDEYSNLTPLKAKSIYLSICMLNQFNVPVRAGIIARRFGITFDAFKQDFFGPLEDVVLTDTSRINDDYSYTARHPHIAEIVVQNELRNVEDLFAEYVACLSELNQGFSSDRRAFQQMTQGRRLLHMFKDPKLVERVFEKAQEIVGNDDGHLLQQMAIYEMNRDNGNLPKATAYLEAAMKRMPSSRVVRHSYAELQLRRAEQARNDLERKRLWSEAETICRQLKRDATDSFPFYTLVKTGIERLKDIAKDDSKLHTEDVEGLIKRVDRELTDGQQLFPGSAPLLSLEAEFAKLLSEEKRFSKALKLAFEANPRNGHAAIQLATLLEEEGNLADAQKVFVDSLEANRNNPRLQHVYGKFLLRNKLADDSVLLYHFARGYSPGDTNYEAQLLHGRQLFCTGDFEGSKAVFKQLSRARLGEAIKREHRYPLPDEFTGTVTVQEAYYCIIRRDGDGALARFDFETSTPDEWRSFARNMKVSYRIGFSMFGTTAFDVRSV